jgi:hypothetical protein
MLYAWKKVEKCYMVVVRISERKRPLGSPMRRRDDNNGIDLKTEYRRMRNGFNQLRTGTSCGLLTRYKPSGCIKFGGLTEDPLIFQEGLCSTELAIYNTAGSYTKASTVPHADPPSVIALLVTALRKQDEAHIVCVTLKHTSE